MTSASKANHNLHPLFSLAYRFRSLKLPRNLIGSLHNLFPAIGQSNYLVFCNFTVLKLHHYPTIRKGNRHEALRVSCLPHSGLRQWGHVHFWCTKKTHSIFSMVKCPARNCPAHGEGSRRQTFSYLDSCSISGETKRRGTDSISGQEEVFWRI